ncbi:MAG: hypothetical protein IJ573_07605 [Clostridia bacterium]|nr:hypothetical protein [Clostridia bacterium]
MEKTAARRAAQRKAALSTQPRERKDADVLESLWAITGRGNNAEVRLREGRLIVYEVKKQIAVG